MSISCAKELDFFEQEKQVQSPVVREFDDVQWTLFGIGATLGVVIELGTNTGELWPCLGQPAQIAEAIYFTYFYIRDYFENGYETTNISYVAVYIARGISATMMGPCWAINPARKNATFVVVEEEDADTAGTNKRKVEPPKNLTPEEKAKIAQSK